MLKAIFCNHRCYLHPFVFHTPPTPFKHPSVLLNRIHQRNSNAFVKGTSRHLDLDLLFISFVLQAGPKVAYNKNRSYIVKMKNERKKIL